MSIYDLIQPEAVGDLTAQAIACKTAAAETNNYPGQRILEGVGSAIASLPSLGSSVGQFAANRADALGGTLTSALSRAPVVPLNPEVEAAREAHDARISGTNVAHYLGAGLLTGGAITALAVLARNLRDRNEEELREQASKQAPPILELSRFKRAEAQAKGESTAGLKTQAPEAKQNRTADWETPAKVVAAPLGVLAGYLLLRKLDDRRRRSRIQEEFEAARAEYDDAVNAALEPRGLRLDVQKAASVQELTDVEAFNAALDLYATGKSASSLGWWALLGAAPLAGLGAHLGWRIAEKGDRDRHLLNLIKKRQVLTSLNSPLPPVLTAPEKRDDEDEEDEEKK
ncbi:MAG: hypothetical protein WC992_00310 [Acholeplasmataceae bacterium]